MIAARTLKSKEAIDELVNSGENMEDIEIAASNAEKALNSIGLTARTNTGEFKDLEVILGEVAGKWDTLSNSTKQYVSEQLAGNNRRSFFIGLMENYERTMQLQELAENSSGKLMEASEKKAESLEGQLNKLQNAWSRLYEAMIGGSVAKGGVKLLTTGVDGLAKAMENLHIILPSVIASFVAFKAVTSGVSLKEFVAYIIELGTVHLKTLITNLMAATGATTGLELAMVALKTVGVGVFVGGLVWAVSEYIKKCEDAKITTEELNGALGNLNSSYSNFLKATENNQTVIADYAEIEKANQELQLLTKGTEEYAEKENYINDKLREIASIYPEIEGALNSQLIPLERKLQLLDQEIEKQEELRKQQARDEFLGDGNEADSMNSLFNSVLGSVWDIGDAQRNIERNTWFTDPEEEAKKIEQGMEDILTAYNAGLARLELAREYYDLGIITEEELATEESNFARIETLLSGHADILEYIKSKNTEVKESEEELIDTAVKLSDSISSVFNDDYKFTNYTDALDDLNEAMKDTEFGASEAEDALKVLTKVFPELEGHAEDLEDVINYLGNQAMLELAEQADQVNSILSEMASEDFTGFDTSTAQQLLTMYPELANHIQDAAYVQEFLNGKVREYQDEINGLADSGSDAWAAYYDNVLAQDADFWANKLANSDQWAEYEKIKQQELQEFGAAILGVEAQDFANYIDEKGGFREVDYTNCVNAADAEATLNNSLVNDMIDWFAGYVTEKAGDRQTDMTNVVAFLNQQGVKEAQTIDELKAMWASFYAAKRRAINAEINSYNKKIKEMANAGFDMDTQEGFEDIIMGTNGVSGAAKHKYANWGSQIKSIESLNDNIENFFNAVDSTFGGIGNGLSQLGATADKLGNTFGGGGSGFKPKPTGGASGGSGGSGGKGGSGSKSPSSGRGSSGSGGSGGKGGSGSGSKATEKEVEDLDLKIDKYTQLEEAIKRADEALARNQQRQEAVTRKSELKTLLDDEINLMNKKKSALEQLQKAQQAELNTAISTLKKSGFIFNGNELVKDGITGGSVTDRLLDAQKWANKASGSEKEWRKKDVLYLQEQINLYYELMGNVSSTQGELNSLNLEIRNAKKEHEKLLKAVENLSDRYLQITMRMEKLDNELSLNQRKQELAVGSELVSLRERELAILSQKKVLNQQNINELKKEQQELQDYLYKAGLRFGSDGTMTNYNQLWAAATNKYNTLAGTAAEDYKEYLDEIAEKTDRYLEILNGELPQAEQNFYDIIEAEKELAKQQEEYAKQLQELSNGYDRLFEVTQKLNKASNELAIIEAKMEHASYEQKLDYLERQEEIYKSQLKLLEQQKNINKEINKDRKNDLMKIGFEFDEDGLIKNYDEVVGKMFDEIQGMEGGTVRDDLIEDYEELISKVEDYNDSLANVSDTEKQWWDMNNAIKDAQQSQLDIVQEIQDSIGNAITNRWQETTDTLKKELQKQQDLLSREWEDEDWVDQLADAQDELNKIQAQINNLSKDTSLAGQMKLEQLKEQYAEQLKAMNDMVKQHEREMTNQAFEDEATRLDEKMEEALKSEELMKSVNEALKTGFVTIGEEAIRLNDLLVDQLKEAKELWGDVLKLGQAITSKTPDTASLSRNNRNSTTVLPNNNAPLVSVQITGDLEKGVSLDDVNRITKQAADEVIVKLYELMK